MRFFLRFDQLCRDPQPIAVAPDGAFDEIVGAQRPADFRRAATFALCALDRRARDDADVARARLRQLRDGFFGQPVGEAVLRAERQDREARALPRRCARSWPARPDRSNSGDTRAEARR